MSDTELPSSEHEKSDNRNLDKPYKISKKIMTSSLIISGISLLILKCFFDIIHFKSAVENILFWLFIAVSFLLIPAIYLDKNLKKYELDKIKKLDIRPSILNWALLISGIIILMIVFFFNIDVFQKSMLTIASTFAITVGLSLFLKENNHSYLDAVKILNHKLFALISAFLFYWAAVQTYSDLNELYRIDQGYFSFTIAAGIGVWFFIIMGSVLTTITVIGMIWLPATSSDDSYKFKWNITSWYWLSNYIVIFFFIFLLGLTFLDSGRRLEFLAEVAYTADFNENHMCKSEKLANKKVIFLGPTSSVVYGVDQSSLLKNIYHSSDKESYDVKEECVPTVR